MLEMRYVNRGSPGIQEEAERRLWHDLMRYLADISTGLMVLILTWSVILTQARFHVYRLRVEPFFRCRCQLIVKIELTNPFPVHNPKYNLSLPT